MIDGVKVKQLKFIPDERGTLMEIIRNDEVMFDKFGQVYMTTAYPGVTKAWHFHKNQDDYMTVVKGMMKIVLYDERPDSPTMYEINEFFVGEKNPILVKIPAGVWHGFKCISTDEAIVINIPTNTYNYAHPDEYRRDAHNSNIPYDWNRKDG